MLRKDVLDHLNSHLNLEFYSSNMYLQMSSWCENKGLGGCAAFLKKHAQEEMDHMHRVFNYINEKGSVAVVGTIEAPPTEFESVKSVFEQLLDHEKKVTETINKIVAAAFEAKDFGTFNFLQWFVSEQHEEETLVQTILDKITTAGTEGLGLYLFDREMTQMAASHG
ncbi:MAG: non-heme ferritin [Candidatus Eisenbacteria bacterium]|nr:non-heme ferritin [Candidatus Eisenbacteria bacterium]